MIHRSVLAIFAAILMVIPSQAQTVQVLERFTAAEKASARGYGLAVDGTGNIYTSGFVTEAGAKKNKWTVRKSTDAGKTWSTVDSFQPHSEQGASSISMITGPQSEVYAVGYYSAANDRRRGAIRGSFDGGKTWRTLDVYPDKDALSSTYYRVATTGNGHIYITGFADYKIGGKEITKWIVRRSPDKGESWETMFPLNDKDDPSSGGNSLAILVDSKGRVWSGASRLNYKDGLTYTIGVEEIFRLDEGDGHWQKMDEYVYTGKRGGWISLFESKQGEIFAVGSGWRTDVDGAPREKQSREGILRKSADDGKTWTTINHFSSTERNAEYYVMAEDSGGALFTTGYAMDDSLKYHAVVRKSTDRGGTWTTIFDNIGEESLGAYGYNLIAHPLLGVIQTGWEWTSYGSLLRTIALH